MTLYKGRIKVQGATFKLAWEEDYIGFDDRDGFYEFPTEFKRILRMYRYR